MLIADRICKDPQELSGLSELDPNDLFWLSIGSAMYRRVGADPEILAPIRHLTGLQMLSLRSTGVTNSGLECLRPLRSLKGLELTQFSIGNQGLAVLKDLPGLEYLALNTSLTDAGLKHVAQLSSLRWLRIVDGKMWGPGLTELARLPRLERLCIQQSRGRLLDRHIKCLEGLTQLKSLTLWSIGCNTLTDASLASIGKLKNLEELYFIRTNPQFTPAGVVHLKGLKNLRKVHFAQTWCGPVGVEHGDEVVRHLAALPHLESITGIGYLSSEGMKAVATLRNLKCLHVALKDHKQDYHGPTGLSHLTNISALEELSIGTGDPLSKVDLASLEPLSHLKDLTIGCPSVPDQGLAFIAKLNQLETLHLGCSVTSDGLNHLNALPNLRYLKVVARQNASRTAPAGELTLDLSGLTQMKDLNLTGLPLHEGDLAFLRHLPLLEKLMIQPTSPLTATSLRHLQKLPELDHLWVSDLSNCTRADMAHLSSLPKLRSLTVKGDITDVALTSLTGPAPLESLYVETDHPIRKETVSNLTKSHSVIEYVHINNLTPEQALPTGVPTRNRVSRPHTYPRTPARRRRRR
jgi:hypothetical protein